MSLKTEVDALKAKRVDEAIEAAGGNRRKAAESLGISLRTLFYIRRRPVDLVAPGVKDVDLTRAIERLEQSTLHEDLKELAIRIVRG